MRARNARGCSTLRGAARVAQVIAAFRSAVHFGDDEAENDEACPYTFINGHVFNGLMQFCLQARTRELPSVVSEGVALVGVGLCDVALEAAL